MQLEINKIKSSPYQPRMEFNLEDIRGSIAKDGIASPIIVRQKDNHYELIDGERRLRMAKELGWEKVPASVIEADDERAMRLVWRLNVERKDYTPKEKAHHFRKCQEQGLSLREIGRIFGYSHKDVTMYLNVFKLPAEYQQAIWAGQIPIGNIAALESLFNGGRPPEEITNWLDQRLSSEELRKALNPTLAKFKEAQIEKAQEAIGEIEPEIKLETPEDFTKAAAALKAKAKKLADELLTDEQRAELEANKTISEEEKAKQAEERRRQKEEEERRREERAEKRVIIKLKSNKVFVKEALKSLPETDRAEILEMVPVMERTRGTKTIAEQFDAILRDTANLLSKIRGLRQSKDWSNLDLTKFREDFESLIQVFIELNRQLGG